MSVITAGVGDNIRLPNGANNDADSGDYWAATGTSFAAPHVAGALALMLDLFPNITPENALLALLIVSRRLRHDVARRGARHQRRRRYGFSRRARYPQSPARLLAHRATSFTFDGALVEVATTLAPARGAMGDWVEHSGVFNGLVFQDKFSRGFRIDNTRLLAARFHLQRFQPARRLCAGHARAVAMGDALVSWFNAPRPTYDPRTPWMEDPDPTFQLSYGLPIPKSRSAVAADPSASRPA